VYGFQLPDVSKLKLVEGFHQIFCAQFDQDHIVQDHAYYKKHGLLGF
jgi:hypothetical protein